jgi:hypothetical protein
VRLTSRLRIARKLPLGLARRARRLQSGRLEMYMAYMLIAVLAVLAVVFATS